MEVVRRYLHAFFEELSKNTGVPIQRLIEVFGNMSTEVGNLKGRKNKQLNTGEVYIGRAMYMGGWRLPKSKWANPFKITDECPRDMVIEKYRQYVLSGPLEGDLNELRGRKLMCWCCTEKCHGDVLIELVKQ